MRSKVEFHSVTTNTKTIALDGSDAKLRYVHVKYTSTATAGNRRIVMVVMDKIGQHVGYYGSGANQGASVVYHYNFGGGSPHVTSVVVDEVDINIPNDFIVPRGGSFVVYDLNNIDVADTMNIGYALEYGE